MATSRYKGVYFDKRSRKKWIARIMHSGVRDIIGSYDTELEAAQAYDMRATVYFKDRARTNKLEGLY